MSDCRFLKENLIDFVEHKLDSESTERLIQHLELCGSCRELARNFAQVWHSVDQFEELEPPRDFWAKLSMRLDAVDEKRESTVFPAKLLPVLRPVLASAAVFVAVLLGYNFGNVPGSEPVAESSEVADLWTEYGLESFDQFPDGSLADIYFELAESADDNGGDES